LAINPTRSSLLPATQAWHVDNDGKEALFVETVGAADTYVTGGWALVPSNYGLQVIYFADVSTAGSGHPLAWNAATGAIQAFSAAGTELVNASAALQSVKYNLRVFGK
jgi:hypothetical protein